MLRRHLVLALLLAACSTTAEPRPPPPAEIEARRVPGTERYKVVTTGLSTDLAIDGVSTSELPLAKSVLQAALRSLPDEISSRSILELDLGHSGARVALVRAAAKELFLIDSPATGTGIRPDRALALAAFERGLEAWERDDVETARRELELSIRLHPGDPRRAAVVELPNEENHLSYALLSRLADGPERERLYAEALRRSRPWLSAQLGASPRQLQAVPHEELVRSAQAIVEANLASEPRLIGGAAQIPSPIWMPDGTRPESLLPAPFLGLYFEGEAADRLRGSELVDLAVGALERLREDPVELLLATAEIRGIWLDEDPLAGLPAEPRPEVKMLSALLADTARKAKAGLDPAEIGATLGGPATPQTLATARAKLRQQRELESGWYTHALQAAQR